MKFLRPFNKQRLTLLTLILTFAPVVLMYSNSNAQLIDHGGIPTDGGGDPKPREEGAPTPTLQVEIEVNATSDTQDDLVEFNGSTACTVRLSNPTGQNVTVVLNNSDNHISFSGQDSAGHLTLLLPGNGNEVGFSVNGASRSTNYGDALISAHQNNVSSPVIGEKSLTVYYFTEAKISVQAGNGYNVVLKQAEDMDTGNDVPGLRVPTYQADNPAVTVFSRIALKPSGISLNAPQISNYRVGYVQNVSNYAIKATYTSPVAVPYPETSGNGVTQLNVNESCYDTDIVSTKLLDTTDRGASPHAPPLYGIGSNYIKFPGQTASSTDDPGITGDNAPYFLAKDSSNNPVGAYTYSQLDASVKATFNDYAVLLDIRTDEVTAFRQINWYLDVSTSTPGAKAQVDQSDTAYGGGMISTGALASNAANPTRRRSTSMVTIPVAQ